VEEEENQPEENGFSNRHVSTTFIPPLTLPTLGINFCFFLISHGL
jgi:hypothetical protein